MQLGRLRGALPLCGAVVGVLAVAGSAAAQCKQILYDSPASGVPSNSYNTGALATGVSSGQNGWVAGSSTTIPSSAQIGVANGGFTGNHAILVTGNGNDLRDAIYLFGGAVGNGCGTTNPPPDSNAGLISVRLKYKKGTVVEGAGVIIKPQSNDDSATGATFGFYHINGDGTMKGRGGTNTQTVTDNFDPAIYPGNGYPVNGWYELEMRLNPNHTSQACDCVTDPATNTQIPFGFLEFIVNGNKVTATGGTTCNPQTCAGCAQTSPPCTDGTGPQNPMAYYGGTNTSGKVGRFTFRREVGSNGTNASAYFDNWEVWTHPRPTLRSQPIIVMLSAAGTYTLSAADLQNLTTGSVAGDQTQTITSRNATPNTFNCTSAAGSGVNTVQLWITQTDGQADSQRQLNQLGLGSMLTTTVTVRRPSPNVSCQAGTLSRACSGGGAVFSVADIKASSSAGSTCSTIGSEQVKKSTASDATYASTVSFDCTELGSRTVVLRVTQNTGEVNTCSRNVLITITDTDGDGVDDGADSCPNTPNGEHVDASGCSCSQKVCNDGDACTIDSCDPQTAACTISPVNCDDEDLCTTDSCDPQTGCVHDPVLAVSRTVVDRNLFYNNSFYDSASSTCNALVGQICSDDTAIATDRIALNPGESADSAHYISYSRGINGLMIDVAANTTCNPLPAGSLAASNFDFKVGNSANLGSYVPAAAPLSIEVIPGGGTGGSDRIKIIWADNAIPNVRWLRVVVLSDANGGSLNLDADNVFYFGLAIGDSETPGSTRVLVGSSDEIDPRNHPHNSLSRVPVATNSTYAVANAPDARCDYDKSSTVTSSDEVIARNNPENSVNGLLLLNPAP